MRIQTSRCDTGQLVPQFVPRSSGCWPERTCPEPSLLRYLGRPTGIHGSICYNKTTILAPTRDDSIGRSEGRPGLFWESRVSRSRLSEQDAPVIVETSSTRYMPPSMAPPSIGCSIMEMVRAIACKLQRKQEKEVKRGEKRKGRNASPPTMLRVLRHWPWPCPPGRSSWREMDLAFRTNSIPLFFEFIDSIGMIPAPSCLLARCSTMLDVIVSNESTVEFLFRKKYCIWLDQIEIESIEDCTLRIYLVC